MNAGGSKGFVICSFLLAGATVVADARRAGGSG